MTPNPYGVAPTRAQYQRRQAAIFRRRLSRSGAQRGANLTIIDDAQVTSLILERQQSARRALSQRWNETHGQRG